MSDPMDALVERLAIKLAHGGEQAEREQYWQDAPEWLRLTHRNEVRLILSDLGPDWALVPVEPTLQARVRPWMMACFGAEISSDRMERGDRFCEEAMELLQAVGHGRERVLALVDYVYGRDAGEPAQEVDGVMITLAALCLAFGMDMHAAGETELARIWTKLDQIRAKQAAKPTGSALPVAARPQQPPADGGRHG